MNTLNPCHVYGVSSSSGN